MKEQTIFYRLHADPSKARKNGDVKIYLLIIIGRSRKYISLDLAWPKDKIEVNPVRLLPRAKRDTQHNDYNLIASAALKKCHEIVLDYRLRNKSLTLDLFLEEYYHFKLKKDFVAYMEFKVKERYKKRQIADQTWKNHMNTITKLKRFAKDKPVAFHQITEKWCKDFENFLRKKENLKRGTAWTHMKDINTYLNLAAKEEDIPVKNPFQEGYSISAGEAQISYLTVQDLHALTDYYTSNRIPIPHKEVLRQFLFSCYTGLRVSDLNSITTENIVGNFLVFAPTKTKRFEKMLKIPLHARARQLIEERKSGQLFGKFTDQAANRILKKIAEACELDMKLTNHVGRHSFATLFLELGGSVEVLRELLGHSKISTTMKYVHIAEERKINQMSNFDKLDF